MTIAAFAALAVPAMAAGTKHKPPTRNYGGKLTGAPGAGFEMSAAPLHGSATKITRFEWHNIPAPCAGSLRPGAVTGELGETMKVKSEKFSGSTTSNAGRLKVTVSGKFKSGTGEQKASGTLRVKGTVPGCLHADTGTVHWAVHQH